MNKINVKGLIATTPRHVTTMDNQEIVSFRLAEKIDPPMDSSFAVNWYIIVLTGTMAINFNFSKGDRINVKGLLWLRDWDNGERSGTSAEIHPTEIKLTKAVRRVGAF